MTGVAQPTLPTHCDAGSASPMTGRDADGVPRSLRATGRVRAPSLFSHARTLRRWLELAVLSAVDAARPMRAADEALASIVRLRLVLRARHVHSIIPALDRADTTCVQRRRDDPAAKSSHTL